MKKLKELLLGVEIINMVGDIELEIISICFDSRKVTSGSIFVVIKGYVQDGENFIDDAIKNGARVIIHKTSYKNFVDGITYIQVADSRLVLAQIAQNFYNHPSKKLKLIGVTGTNGKTTTATLLFNLFRNFGFHSALLSTIENKIDEEIFPATHTTPDPVALASFLSLAVSKGCEYVFIECSSQAIDQKRLHGLHFIGMLFTNVTHDHLDYHKTLETYAEVKKSLFDTLPETAFAVANQDDERSDYILSDTPAKKYFFSLKENSKADFILKINKQSLEGLDASIDGNRIHTKLIGKFNAYNILGIFAIAKILGIQDEQIISSIKILNPPTGRLQFFKSPKGFYGIVDYAHTPDALQNVLTTVREITPSGGHIITVVGCGGDRDTLKRPIMGAIACKLSDFVIFSSDDPRSENPDEIIKDITGDLPKSIKNYESITDRVNAVAKACSKASSGDVVLLAGKGHEQYQIFKDKKVHFSDIEEIRKNFKSPL
ncbi:MAG: UDP-N-acetylmuramoyl-L-alanyl-D-glutamate--2,6-diaminopimelate ligase [Candidatus Zambryskibacteria bacterium]|nr:UDP-N-acetylmuramoyl-L-alanyl-D-glutamate--2,6-diaminopimelate ligase [Candidatus Zambryskibacteria bacterium]